MALEPGLRASLDIIVRDCDTAASVGSGDVPVLATPRLLALAEAACVAAIGSRLDPGATSVGISALIRHTRASPVGAGVVVEAELTEVDGRRLVFSFRAWHAPQGPGGQDEKIVGQGTVERVLVDRDRFLARVGS